MKKLFYFISACSLLALASCSCDEDNPYGTKTIEYSITANAPNYDVTSTTDLGAVARVYWDTENPDMVGVYANGTAYLGYLTASNTTTDGGRTTFTGKITKPTANCTLVFVYATGIIGAEPVQSPAQGTYQSLLTAGGIQYDMSQQTVTGMKVPFCAYATVSYSNEDTEDKHHSIQNFKLATSNNVATLSGPSAPSAINKAEITHIASSVSLSWNGNAVSVGEGDSNGTITINYTDAKTNKMIAFATPKSASTTTTQRHMIINEVMAFEFTNNALDENQFYAAGYSSFDKMGIFSVSPTKRVVFSPGNLQAEINSSGEPTKWKFAEHQYDRIGNAVANTSIGTTAGTIDLFGWSTDGGTPKPDTYKPWGINTSTDNSDYAGDFQDWGTNPDLISDLGQGWHTLDLQDDAGEWYYLIATRVVNGGTGKNKSYLLATINSDENEGVNGIILYPDNYTDQKSLQKYTSAEWLEMEDNGCVFLPTVGYRIGSSVTSVGSIGSYRSSGAFETHHAYFLHFGSGAVYIFHDDRDEGYAVRLVREL